MCNIVDDDDFVSFLIKQLELGYQVGRLNDAAIRAGCIIFFFAIFAGVCWTSDSATGKYKHAVQR